MENELKLQLEKYRLYEHAEQDGDPNIQARRQFFLELDYQRAKEGENIFREITKLSRVGTMRAKDRECTLRIVRQLVTMNFPKPSQQADIDWAIGYIHFGISQDTWTTAGLNWFQNAVQGWKGTSKYYHDPIQGLDILALEHRPAIAPSPWDWLGMGKAEYSEWRRVLEEHDPRLRITGVDLGNMLAPEVFLNTPDLLTCATVSPIHDIIEKAIYFASQEVDTTDDVPVTDRRMGGMMPGSSGLPDQTPPAAKRIRSVRFDEELKAGGGETGAREGLLGRGCPPQRRTRLRHYRSWRQASLQHAWQ